MTQQNTIIQQKLAEYFETSQQADEDVFNQLVLYVYAVESQNSDLHLLAKILPQEYLTKLINYYDGDTLKLPSKENYMQCYLTALTYYLKCIKRMSWSEIKEMIDLPEKDKDIISSISLGYSINRINRDMTRDLKEILKQFDGVDYQELIKRLKDGLIKNREEVNE